MTCSRRGSFANPDDYALMADGIHVSSRVFLGDGFAANGGVRAGLTTPIAYLANCWIDDPFTAGASILAGAWTHGSLRLPPNNIGS